MLAEHKAEAMLTRFAMALTGVLLGGGAATWKHQYSVSRDGRFLINQLVETSAPPITLILNWKPKLSSADAIPTQ